MAINIGGGINIGTGIAIGGGGGPGSTVASSTINVGTNSGASLVFFIQGQTGAATYNYPFTFS